MDNAILEPVYIVQSPVRTYFLIPVHVDGSFGLFNLPAVHASAKIETTEPEIKWRFRLKRFKGLFVAEITPKLTLFKGLIETPDIWRPVVVQCDESQVELIKLWIESLNKNTGRTP